jgi:plastocyanin
VAFVEKTWSGPAGRPFTIAFDNQDAGTPHNVALIAGSGSEVFKGDIFPGVATHVYNVTAQPAGEYKFVCTVHPAMTGTATLK